MIYDKDFYPVISSMIRIFSYYRIFFKTTHLNCCIYINATVLQDIWLLLGFCSINIDK